MMLHIARIIFYILFASWIFAIMLLTDWTVSKPDRPPKAVGWNGADIIYEDVK